jgi:hypothetical protein
MFIEKSAVIVQVCRVRGERKTELGRAELILAAFCTGVVSFSLSANIWSSTLNMVRTLSFDAALSSPLSRDVEET